MKPSTSSWRRYAACLLFVCLGFLPAAIAQPGPQPLVNPNDAKYTIKGQVINSITGEPVPRTFVQISGADQQALLTDGEGRFEFSGLPAGQAMVRVYKPGFFQEGANAQHQGAWFPKPLQVGPDLAPVVLRVVPEAVIVGHVEDGNGEPVEGAMVQLMRSRIVSGRQTQERRSGGTTEEDGNFRLSNMDPGSYYVAVQPGRSMLRVLTDASVTRKGFQPIMYYPMAPDRGSASLVEVKPGQRLELEFVFKEQPVFQITGDISGCSANRGTNVQIADRTGEDTFAFPRNVNQQTGKFEIQLVPAGSYLLRCNGQDSEGHMMQGEHVVNVTGNVSGVSLTGSSSVSIPVNVRVDFTNTQLPDRNSGNNRYMSMPVSISLQPVEPGRHPMSHSQPAEDGSLSVPNVLPGHYWVEVQSAVGGYVQSARSGTTDLIREALVVPAAGRVQPIDIVLRDDSPSLMVKVNFSTDNAPTAVVVSRDAAPGQPPRMFYVAGQGHAGIGGLAPGEYRVFAFDPTAQVEYTDPEVLEHYSAKAARVTLAPGMTSQVSVDLIHPEER